MMQPLPQEFLEQVATEKYLTNEQQEAFVALYQDANRAPESIANDLFISPNAFRTRLSGVYKAFGIDGKGSNKKRRLYQELLEMYRQRQGRDSDDPILDRGIDDFVERIRRQVAADIKQRCGTMRVLDMAQPVGLGEIYTDVNILEKVSRSRRQDLSQIHELVGLDLEDFKRFSFGAVAIERVAGLEVVKEHRKLMIWGKPGAGKTTFLKHLAMSCIEGQLFPELVPFFVTLKSFAEEDGQPNLFTYLHNQAVTQGVDAERIKEIVVKGRAMIFLDGLDEVRQEDSQRVIKGIQEFADIWRENFFAITCRIAAKEYTFQNGFTEVEVADFDDEQIEIFVNNWFRCKKQDKKAEGFIYALKEQKPIQELASSPLLLTLLCLVFEENFHFPQNRAELYKEGLDILLKKWDGKRAIQRDEIYKNLTVKRREDLLSEIAFTTFEKGEYFFKQAKLEEMIAGYILNLPDAKDDPEALRLDSEVVLKSIEAQHGLLVERAKGIYSFSHLTFQEYLAARYLAAKPQLHDLIINNFSHKRWREVNILVLSEISDRDLASWLAIKLKNAIDQQMNGDQKLQDFLRWLDTKEQSIEANYSDEDYATASNQLNTPFLLKAPPPLSRSLYLYLYLYLSRSLFFSLSLNFPLDLYLDLSLYLDLDLSLYLYLYFSLNLSRSSSFDLDRAISKARELNLEGVDVLQGLRDELPPKEDKENCKNWSRANGTAWRERLRQAMIKYRNIGHDWQWTDEQKEILENYGNVNRLLLECLRSAYIRRDVREWIENTMFLPMSVIETMPPPEL